MEKNKATAKRSQFLTHEANIIKGSRIAVEAWLDAAVECRDRYRGNASEYARQSVSDYHTETTIRQYVGACLKALSKYGNTPKKVMDHLEFVELFGYANIDDLRSLVAEKKKSDEKSRKEKKQSVTSRKVRAACGKAGLSAKQTEQVLEALGF